MQATEDMYAALDARQQLLAAPALDSDVLAAAAMAEADVRSPFRLLSCGIAGFLHEAVGVLAALAEAVVSSSCTTCCQFLCARCCRHSQHVIACLAGPPQKDVALSPWQAFACASYGLRLVQNLLPAVGVLLFSTIPDITSRFKSKYLQCR